MTDKIVSLVQKSFRKLVPIADQVGTMFYARLFETYPEVRPMFAEDIAPQAKKLVQMLALVVNGLHRLDEIMPAVEQLARRHNDYGVVEAHYCAVGETLLWTLQQGLGDDFTPEVEAAWTDAYGLLSAKMIAAAKEGAVA
ncbi:globin family protein [Shinella zoogloeoides]|uniref:Hemin receptor n=1 Tax=Shinella zoogloeoides TaxID=352475 RepID=A0A6N8TGL1_SHIZO|nr:globin family protein [Shinella zoogloeoides]MXO01326.1 hemin receptor [Shinella zoogloeoides]UEX81677.1 globin domain-containing protein [Shinella zoogloeoides]